MKLMFKNFTLMTSLLFLLLSNTAQAQLFSKKAEQLLPEEEAFDVIANLEGNALTVSWIIAEGYYMYRDKFSIESATPGVQVANVSIPPGAIENDPEFGEVEVYFYNADLSTSLSGPSGPVELIIKGQGCNKPVGVCYPPLTRNFTVDFSSAEAANQATTSSPVVSTIPATETVKEPADTVKSFWAYVVTALIAGWLLSFTPCVLPMIPILAGVIAGQKNPSRLQSGWLAICYVLGTIVTYAIAGWVAGASGTQLQAHFQNPWVLGTICLILIVLAFSLFGAFKIQLPSSIQTKLNGTQVNNRSASISSFVLGLISALVVGACVSPILIITLGAAITQGDPVLGAAIMSAMALGMGTLLILFGFGAGWLLPKSGAWMQHVQVIFGFMVLGVAVYLSGSIGVLPTLLLWAVLLIWTGVYLFKMSSEASSSLIDSAIKTVALVCIIWGTMALLGGASSKNEDILKPLSGISAAPSTTQNTTASLVFNKVTSLEETKNLLASAKTAGKPVMVDFYADWCLDCKRMHRTTYKEASVIDALKGWEIIEIDVTDTSDKSETVKQFFGVFGPPATLFFKADGIEKTTLRQYGYMNEEVFLNIINQARG